ncbi:endonuclease/exonuclease/phosphatase family protein [Vallicoccus soli]|uniref:Endonuclease n=1 Tax=Vallicoccus soli TaxID=2339232 RepID=A0A3A3YYS0_9ACTN|nr:endonuclease/exonuclease/phosphatase family protein [Vallicoccus soli]RJK96880.1 endonuclease [Vallicoccus soli]
MSAPGHATGDATGTAAGGAGTLRLLSWNVRSLRDDVGAVVEVLRDLRPDVVCLQEAPRFGRWRHALSELARRSELYVTCGGATTTGPALLTSLAVDVRGTYEARLSRTPRLRHRLHRRGLAAARLRLRGAEWLVASTHLGLDAGERARHAAEVAGRLAAWRGDGSAAVVLAGDLNEAPGGPVWSLLAGDDAVVPGLGLRDARAAAPDGGDLTFPARAPRRRIDAVLAGGARVDGCGVPEHLDPDLLARATDHRPVLARLTAARPAAGE